jgi:hypothetical protein
MSWRIIRNVFLIICLWSVRAFAATDERTNTLQIGDANTTITFEENGSKYNAPSNGSAGVFTGADGVMRNITVEDPTGTDTVRYFEEGEEVLVLGNLKSKTANLPIQANGIHFSGSNFAGKTLTLNNGGIEYGEGIDCLISAKTSSSRYMVCPEYKYENSEQKTVTVPAQYAYMSAAAINLGGVLGSATPPPPIYCKIGQHRWRESLQFPGDFMSTARIFKPR